jgi:predicted DNA-binding transcriptional regulator YafY
VERRLEFIEFRLFWEGGINRSDITDFFGVSVPQASKDLSQYQELAPGNMDYDRSGKRYLTSAKFKPRFLKPDPDRYLSQLRSIADRLSLAEETWLCNLPELDSMSIPHRSVDPAVLRAVLAAIRGHRSIEVLYQSMNPTRPDPVWRWITPHAFGSDGFRWHVRAFCHIDRTFKDFLLSRCLEQRNEADAGAKPSEDHAWQEFIEVILKPNPKLSLSQRQVIASDFGMNRNETKLPVRKALLYYFQKRLRIDVADVLDNLQEAPVVVANKEIFNKAMAEAMK